MEELPARTSLAGGRKFRLAGHVRETPMPGSVHRVDDELGETACGIVDVSGLARLHRARQEWLPLYRCRVCQTAHPEP